MQIKSFQCKNVKNDEILEAKTEYKFDHQIKLKVVKPEIIDVVAIVNQYNQKKHFNAFVKLYNIFDDLITYPIEKINDEDLNSNILYLYMIIIERVRASETTIFALKSLQEKQK